MNTEKVSLGTDNLTLSLKGLKTKSRDHAKAKTPSFEPAHKKLQERFQSLEVAFFNAAENSTLGKEISAHDLCKKTLDQLGLHDTQRNPFTDILFLGIGGSSLGPLSCLTALENKARFRPKIHFLENPDPNVWAPLQRSLNPDSTLVIVIAKSGTTFETLALFKLALDWLQPKRFQSHTIAVTDPAKGDLRKLVEDLKLRSLPIHPGIGGRFSIFSPVGLFPMLCAGLDTKSFLYGAEQIRSYCLQSPLHENVLHQLALELVASEKSHPTHVFMPYSSPLKLLGQWFVQMWGESLGKASRGFTPLAALGAVDQHSLLQLLKEGPNDKITWFVELEEPLERVTIPVVRETEHLEAFKRLSNHSLDELLKIELQATQRSLQSSDRPFVEFGLKKLNEESLGSFYFALSYLTAITGTLMGIDPFDQPGVEEGKIYIRESLLQANVRSGT